MDGLEDESVAAVYTTKEKLSEVLSSIHDHRKEVRLALRQPSLNFTTVLQTEVCPIKIIFHFFLNSTILTIGGGRLCLKLFFFLKESKISSKGLS